MAISIDEPTLMTVLGIVSLTASVMFFVLASFARQLPGVCFWAFGSMAVGFATIIDGPRLISNWQLASVFFNIPFSIGQVFILAGTMQFCGRPGAHRAMRMLSVLLIALVLGFTFVFPDATWRIGTISAFQAAVNIWTGVLLWRYPDAFARRAFHVASVIVFLQAYTAVAQGTLIVFSELAVTYASPEFPIANLISWSGVMTNVVLGNWILFMLIMLRLVGDLRIAAERDVLTGLLNRRGLRPRVDSILRRANGGCIGIMILDIDHFKAVNDTLGHDVGDKVLAMMGEVLLTASSDQATPCRWGGEEFCVVVEGQDARFMTGLADTIRSQFLQRTLTVPGLDQGCTVSAGITLAQLDANFEMSKAISVADAQLYRAKENGRDQVMIAGHATA